LKPFLVTNIQAGKLPRWGLLLLCVLYTLPGLIGRDPWRADDAASFGVALTMARGQLTDWLLPNLAGLPMIDRGPLAGWVQAIAIQVGLGLNHLGLTFVTEHLSARVVTMGFLGAGLALVWYGAYELASRKNIQPNDPFGVAADKTELGRAIADSTLLILMACFGLIARVHETSVDAIQFTWTALAFFALAYAPERPKLAGWLFGLALACTALTRGPHLAFGFFLGWLFTMLMSAPFRWIVHIMVPRVFFIVLIIIGSWLLALQQVSPNAMTTWLSPAKFSLPTMAGTVYYGRTFTWFFWPAWPIAFLAAWGWRTRLNEPIIGLSMSLLGALGLTAFFQPIGSESALLPLIIPFAALAAMGLPTLKRSIGSLIDWFAVISFTFFSLVIWAYWLAFLIGYPEKMAQSVGRIAPGFEPKFILIEIVLGGLASVAWLLLIKWRLDRHTSTLWRPVALSCGGLVLTWFLLMTLWLPFFNQRNSYQEVAVSLNQKVQLGKDCVSVGSAASSYAVGTTERASFFYYSNMRFGDNKSSKSTKEECQFMLFKDEGPAARILNNSEPGWKLVWQGGRRNMKDERFRLYQKKT
jgi:4-amino-4-deoxy-L-arabinose transferase-like glycosyltransferase